MRNDLVIKYISFIIFAFAGLVFVFYLFFAPPKNFPVNTTFSIEKGSVLSEIGSELREANIIRSELALKFFAVLFGGDRNIVAGDYFFDHPINVWSVASRISLGRHNQKALKVTIPEGFTTLDIGELLDSQLANFDPEIFQNKAKPLEGFLFPDTYFFYPATNEDEVIKLLTDNFKSKTDPLKAEIRESGHSLKEIIIMASLIEKESGGLEDKAPISGILWKRIQKGIRLQVDAWPETYEKTGLPENPIANPGMDSIRAAIYPIETEYLFYLHDADRVIHYAETFEQHKANKFKYLR